ncbi:hypothetical protein GCM10009844_19430 [Nocardioides koreensis]|uniref:DUF4268 domain-containing protein n=2 Tax=Nocardioides koreensis TaxID=433651 RepID=A0ABN2ZNS6_9ACTN
MLAKIRAEYPTWTRSTAGSTQSWITLPYGTSTTWYGMAFTSTGPRVELYFGGPDAAANLAEFERFTEHRQLLDDGFGGSIQFDPLPGKKACRIHIDRLHGDVLDADSRGEFLDWFVSTMAKFRPVTQRIRATLESTT